MVSVQELDLGAPELREAAAALERYLEHFPEHERPRRAAELHLLVMAVGGRLFGEFLRRRS